MKAWSVIGLLFAAAIFATIPISPQVTPRGLELGVDGAKAVTYGHYRRVHRRVYRRHYRYARRAYRRAYYWGAPSTTTVLPPTMGGGTGTIEVAQRVCVVIDSERSPTRCFRRRARVVPDGGPDASAVTHDWRYHGQRVGDRLE
jgi:hypothetical protein